MRVLLDTHVFLWWIDDDRRLSQTARDVIAEGQNDILFSAVCGWEIAIKASLGRIEAPADFARFLTGQITKNDFRVQVIELAHTLQVRELPHHHRDAFDRLLIATCQVEKIPLLTSDSQLSAYEIETIW